MRKGTGSTPEGWEAERKARRLSDGEIAAIAKDVAAHEALAVRYLFRSLDPSKGEDWIKRRVTEFVYTYSICLTTSKVIWAGVERMFTFYPTHGPETGQMELL